MRVRGVLKKQAAKILGLQLGQFKELNILAWSARMPLGQQGVVNATGKSE
jgi:hypothetical protein